MKFLKGKNKDDYMFINCIYYRGRRDTNWEDQLAIIYKNLNTGEKEVEIIDNPEMDLYFMKDEFRTFSYNKSYAPLEQLDVHSVPFRNVEHYIAKTAGGQYQSYYRSMIESRNFNGRRNIHKFPYVFGSEYDMESWVRIQWLLHNDNQEEKPITKTYLDIEVDIINVRGFPKPGECPINAVTMIDEKEMRSFTFLLRNDKNPLIAEFERDIEAFKKELADDFDETYGKLDYRFYMYDEDDETSLITDLFQLIHALKRDFLLIWNMDFDANFIMARCTELGLDYREIMSHPDFPTKHVYYKKDKVNFDVKNKSDYFTVSSYTVWLDQMLMYAGLRKGQGEQRSFNLNTIGKVELGDEKLDYSDVSDLKMLPYTDYKRFVKYNIKDVLMQMGIERRTLDVDNVYDRAYSNATTYEKIFKQTIFIRNRAYVEYYKQGVMIGNNVNIDYSIQETDEERKARQKKEKEDKFDGALVADPLLNHRMGITVFGTKSKSIFNSVIDEDFSQMYPSEIIAFNISPATMIGKLSLDSGNMTDADYVNRVEKLLDNGKIDDMGKDFIDNYLTQNVLNLSTKWFNLPSVEKVVKEFATENGLLRQRYVREWLSDTRMIFNDNAPLVIDLEEAK